MQFWLILLVSLLAGVSGGPLKFAGDCATRIVATKSKDGNWAPIARALQNECRSLGTSNFDELLSCLRMAEAVENLINVTADEAVLLQRICDEISAYKNVAVIQNAMIEVWDGTIRQFLACQGSTWISADCRARYGLLKPLENPFFYLAMSSACPKFTSNATEAISCIDMSNRFNNQIRDAQYASHAVGGIVSELNAFKGISEDHAYFIETALVGGWGTLQQFIDCPGPLDPAYVEMMEIDINMPSSWTYPPKGYPAGRGQQTKEMAEANANAAMNKVKAAMENDNAWIIVDHITITFSNGIEVLDFEKVNSTDYASFGGTVVIINNDDKIVGTCVKRVANKCTRESEFTFGINERPKATAICNGEMNPAVRGRMDEAFTMSLDEQGLLLPGQRTIRHGE